MNIMQPFFIVVAVLTLMPFTAAHASDFSAAQKKDIAKADKKLKRGIESAHRACGASIEAAVDWTTYADILGAEKKNKPSRAGNTCITAIKTIASLCKDDTFKPLIVEKISKIRCYYDAKADPKNPAMAVNDKIFSIGYHFNTENIKKPMKKYLGDHL